MGKYKGKYGEKILSELKAVPILETSKGIVVLTTLDIDVEKNKRYF